ncbi:MAG: hypothetical protein R3F39_00535 [Myxococcota bacterium]
MNAPPPPRLRPSLVLGIALGAIAAAGLALLGTSVAPSPTMRIPAQAVLRGHVPDALRYATAEANRLRADPSAWPPAPLRVPGRAPVADEGVFHLLPGAHPLATAWLHLPGDTDATVRITAWPTARVGLVAAADTTGSILAWLPALPSGAAVDHALEALGAAPHAGPRASDDSASDDAVALCRTAAGTAMLLRGRTPDSAGLVALMRHLGCDAPGAVWRAGDGAIRLRTGRPPRGLPAWALTPRPVDTAATMDDDAAPVLKEIAGGPWIRNASILLTEAPTSSAPSSRSDR